MIDKKIFAGGKMNKDDDQHLLPKNDWVDARNVRINSTADGYLGSFSNMKGMDLLYTLPVSIEPSTVIGAKGFDNTNKIYFFVADPNGNNKVIEYNGATNTTTIIIEDLTDTGGIPVLNFSTSYRINHIDLLDGKYLLWTDGFNPPRYYDLNKNYGVITNRDISIIKYAPNTPPTNLAVIDNPSILANKIKDTNYQFAYRWIYWDNSKSTFSPISDISNQNGRASGVLSKGLPEWYSSSLTFNYEGGGDLVKGVDIMSRVGNTGDWAIISSVDYEKGDFKNSYAINLTFNQAATEYFISVTYLGVTYNFGNTYASSTTTNIYGNLKANFDALGLTGLIATVYQSGTNYLSQDQYLVISSTANGTNFTIQTTRPQNVNVVKTSYLQSNAQTNTYVFTDFQPVNIIDQSEASRPFDYVPLKAEAQALANGNYVVYGNYTEGYDNVAIDASATKVLKSLNSSTLDVTQATTSTDVTFTFVNNPVAGDVFVISKYNPINVQYTYSVPYETGETKYDFLHRIAFLLGTYFEGTANVYASSSTSVTILKNGADKKYLISILSANTVQGLKTSDEYQYGLVYVDVAGRYGAVNTSQSLVVNSNPLDKYNGGAWTYVTGQITIKSRPPLWADKYAIVRTKRKKIDFFLDVFANNITKTGTTATVDVQTALLETNERYGTNLSYSWVKGDRIRFINKSSANTGEFISLDTEITSINDEGKLIIAANTAPTDMSASGYYYSFFCEIYRPSAVINDNLFWEIAEFGDIGNKGLSTNYHKKIYTTEGNQDQSSSSPTSTPLIHVSQTGDVWYKNRFLPVSDPIELLIGQAYYEAWCESPSFSDFNCDTFTTDAGRANQQNAFEKQVTYNSTVRFGNGYVPGTQINNINSFSNESYQDYSNLYGSIQKLDIDGSVMIVGQKLRLGRVRVFEKLIIDKVDDTLVSNSEKLLNGIVYYDFEAGIGDSPEAYVRAGSKVYGVDKNRGIVWRLAQNGITPISITAKMNTYFRAYLRTATAVRGGFDPKNQEYVIYSLAGSLSGTVIFSENSDGFTSFLDIVPNYFATLKNDLYSFGGDKFYRHNATNAYGNFYGTNYDATVTIISNESPITKKSFIAINEVTNDTWDATEINTSLSQTSSLLESDFAVLEGESHAAFLRDSRTTPGVTYPLINGDQLKGKWIKVKLRNNSTNFVYLLSVGIKYVQSPQTGL